MTVALPRIALAVPLLAALLLALATLPAMAAEGDPIGRIVLAVGDVTAQGADGTTRRLRRRAPVYEGDTVRTGRNGRTQIRFVDGARIALRPSTDMAMEEYRFRPAAPAANRSRMRLNRGGFRKVTGGIGRLNRSNYRVSTPYAVIGIRGTDYGAFFDPDAPDPVLVVGTNDGTVSLTNDFGELLVGDQGDFGFGIVEGPDQPPVGADAPPEDLQQTMGMDLPAEDGDGEDGQDGGPPAGTEGDDDGDDTDIDETIEVGDDGDDGDEMFSYGERCL